MVVTWFSDGQPSYNTMVDIDTNMFNHVSTLFTTAGNAGVLQGSILRPTLFVLYLNDLPDDVICNIAIHADDTTLYSKYDQVCSNN